MSHIPPEPALTRPNPSMAAVRATNISSLSRSSLDNQNDIRTPHKPISDVTQSPSKRVDIAQLNSHSPSQAPPPTIKNRISSSAHGTITPTRAPQTGIQTRFSIPITPPASHERNKSFAPNDDKFEVSPTTTALVKGCSLPSTTLTNNSPASKPFPPFASRIMAQSAIYSQSIQRSSPVTPVKPEAPDRVLQSMKPKPSGPATPSTVSSIDFPSLGDSAGGPPGPTTQTRFHGTFSLPSGQPPPAIPHLTYHQLQQQQHQPPQNTPRPSSLSATFRLFEPAEIPQSDLSARDSRSSDGSWQNSTNTKPTIRSDPLDNPHKTTNVYINGLPLHFTDDELYRLTRGFGAVKSVKMFTRHLEDKPSAYGFVLFDRVEDAERFILTLRQHTQFHPSFAKTGKVPSTTNSKDALKDPIIPLLGERTYADITITGLPLNSDMQTLQALFAPQIIRQSKFFHTTGAVKKLVGFIRLDSQQAAEHIIERLNGSTVLGWSEKLEVKIIATGTNNNRTYNPVPGSVHERSNSLGAVASQPHQYREGLMQDASRLHSQQRFSSFSSFKPRNDLLDHKLNKAFASMNMSTPDIRTRAASFGFGTGMLDLNVDNTDLYNPRLIKQLAELQILRMHSNQATNLHLRDNGHIGEGVDRFGGAAGQGLANRSLSELVHPGKAPMPGSLPSLLPALSPSQVDSPEGSMSSGSPITPTFPIPRSTRGSLTSVNTGQ